MIHYFYPMEAQAYYESRISTLTASQKKLQQRKSVFSVLRLGSIIAVIATFYFLWSVGKLYAFAVAIILLAIFIKLIYRDLANRAAIKHLENLITINQNELLALQGKYFQFANGGSFAPHDHFYANDMDIFGHASLFQFLNRTSSEPGAATLAQWLLNPAIANVILQRQAAIHELSKANEFTQHLQALGKESSIKQSNLYQLTKWLNAPTAFIQFKPWQWLRFLMPAIILSITGLYIADIITEGLWYLFLFIFAAISFQINKVVAPLHNQLSGMVSDLQVLSQSIEAIESQSFSAPLLLALQQQLRQQEATASARIKALKKILNRLDLRYNVVVAIPLNIFFSWSLQQVLQLEKWKLQHNDDVQNWFNVLAEMEALNSFAAIKFNHPQWCFPKIKDEHFSLHAINLGHPLINEGKRVNNPFSIAKAGEIMLVTGSNMAGKSTYLRSVGINTILAMAGAPVCATEFSISEVQLLSSMRIADNLEESTSTFYAELKKLKTVIEKINAGEKVFILLDEILRGTNSLDRHTGSEALIRQLIKQHAAAVLATHDVALASLENDYPNNILNFHFDAQVSGEELFFDYKLKQGVCNNMNASLLMKKIGLEMG